MVGGGGRRRPLASVRGLQHRLAERQVPVVLGAVLFKVLPCHVLRGALLKFHFTEAAVLRCALGRRKETVSDPSLGKSQGKRGFERLKELGNKHFPKLRRD